MTQKIAVEVAFATPQKQVLTALRIDAGSTAADAIAASGIKERFKEFDWQALDCGVWGESCSPSRTLKAGDRVEIYRPLQMDPRESRRLLAQSGKTMRRDEKG